MSLGERKRNNMRMAMGGEEIRGDYRPRFFSSSDRIYKQEKFHTVTRKVNKRMAFN